MPLDASRVTPTQIGNYDVLGKIAEGGMGTVYKGRRQSDGLIVAIKIIPGTTAKNQTLLDRFKREFQAAAALDHPNIVKAIDYFGSGSSPFLVMEFVDGESLGQKVEREGRLPEEEAVRLIAQVCAGLHYTHKSGLIHRDVKPDNILVTADGVAKLTDLGLVKDTDDDLNLTRTNRGLGTPHFMAPEQFRNAKNATVRCDVYSLGATLYMLVTGETPFAGCSPIDTYMKKHNNEFAAPRKLVPSLSERIDWAICRAMSADPDRRPSSCKEFLEDLTGRSVQRTATLPILPLADPASEAELWYMVYKDETGEVQTVKGSTDGIRRALKDRLLGDPALIRVSTSKQGPFQTLKQHPEFRDLVVEPATMSPTAGRATPAGNSWPRRDRSTVGEGMSATPPNSSPVAGPLPNARPSPEETLELRTAEEDVTSSRLPHLRLGPPAESGDAHRGNFELVLWLCVVAIAAVTAIAGSLFFTGK